MHCKYLVLLVSIFFLFLFFIPSFFSSACEFQFIERIGTPGKQNPGITIFSYPRRGRYMGLPTFIFFFFFFFPSSSFFFRHDFVWAISLESLLAETPN